MKIFTLEEANALLPEARQIVSELRAHYRKISIFRETAKAAAKSAQFGGGGGMQGGTVYVNSIYQFNELTARLDELGIQLKDYERGLIDFPALREGRIVLLCWQLGEGDEIEWWHDIDAGFAGRRRI